MTVQTGFHNWQQNPIPATTCAPNLVAGETYLEEMYGGTSLGCYSDRPIRSGEAPSSHKSGAARDWRWGYAPGYPGVKWISKATLEQKVLPDLIWHSNEFGIQAKPSLPCDPLVVRVDCP